MGGAPKPADSGAAMRLNCAGPNPRTRNMIIGKMISRIANPVPWPKFAATSSAMKTHSTKIPRTRSQPRNGIHASRLPASIAQKNHNGRFDILTTLYSL